LTGEEKTLWGSIQEKRRKYLAVVVVEVVVDKSGKNRGNNIGGLTYLKIASPFKAGRRSYEVVIMKCCCSTWGQGEAWGLPVLLQDQVTLFFFGGRELATRYSR